MRTKSLRPACLALAAITLSAGCATQSRYATEEFAPVNDIGVQVSNNNWMDIVVYAVTSGNRVRLGSVTTGGEKRFRLPPSVRASSTDLRLEAHPVGSSEVFSSDAIMVQPGGQIIWSIENVLSLSSFRVASSR